MTGTVMMQAIRKVVAPLMMRGSQQATLGLSRLWPAGCALAFMPFANCDPEVSYEAETTIRYNVEWGYP